MQTGNIKTSAAGILVVICALASARPPARAAETATAMTITNAGPSVPATNAAYNPALLRTEDMITIKVYQEPDLDTEVKVNSKGVISLALVGDVPAAGLLAEVLERKVQDLYAADYLVNPKVTLTVKERAKRHFTVLGQVTRPGVYEFPAEEGLNLLQAVAIAGGYTRMASATKVALQRMQNGEPKVFKYDADRMAKQKDARPVDILPDDVITVPERLF
jgi:protein involved in polysaccharide export with SLBB domain